MRCAAGLLGGLWQHAALVLFPPRCGACNVALAQRPRQALCPLCRSTLKPAPPWEPLPLADGILWGHAAFAYQGAVKALVQASKFAGREDLAAALGELLATAPAAVALGQSAHCLVPLPLGPGRLGQRGFNQALIIARVLARRLRLPLRRTLRRRRDTAPQSMLPPPQRRQNVAGAFAAGGALQGTVLLIDDVVTTGATLQAAADACLAAGADRIVALCVARAGELAPADPTRV